MYDTKTLTELEKLASNLRAQIALHPEFHLEEGELKECERLIEQRRRELRAELARIRRES